MYGFHLTRIELHSLSGAGHYSNDFIHDFLLENIKNSIHFNWIRQIKEHNKAMNIVSMPSPLLSELNPNNNLVGHKSILNSIKYRDVECLYSKEFEKRGTHYLPLPSELYNLNFNATAGVFKASKETDYTHLSRKGSEQIFNTLIQHLESY